MCRQYHYCNEVITAVSYVCLRIRRNVIENLSMSMAGFGNVCENETNVRNEIFLVCQMK
jgi:hypothetical protein